MSLIIGSFDVIIGMDWLSPYRAEILSYDKELRLSLPNGKSLMIYRDMSSGNLRIISCMKVQKYLHKKYYAFLAHVVNKEERKEIKDIHQVCDCPDVFPEDLTGLPPIRDVEFQIDLVLGATLVEKSPYRLAPFGNTRNVWIASRASQ